ncbi:MAG TPA: DUF4390 domain-containing protein [Thermoanaerobaculales bacterium]|nr:DUF4390 domain-containing protein [Thermoanaerobaculales bacterium]HPA81742.1 DUF4390 domain-containing protein [Thermoanaerobaculales bacterium]HQL28573.1 DUF4390 domain-containing protein [Thermoanaerobaculales bacterium]HQN95791.1 DUF4390 domain-containing protein [Thermoanaerobaculales bacterium]HQP44234.1 DUF4390 domain-containing protein [Thermoanaerobaculales bacterium]
MRPALLAMLLAAAAAAAAPLVVQTELSSDTLTVAFRLDEPLPASLEDALPSGATVEVRYQVRVRSARKLWWDKKMWKGEAVATAVFDPIIGRYECELVLDGVIVTSHEVETTDAARSWLSDPGPVRFALPEGLEPRSMEVRVRAVFSSSTKWLFFPDTEGTDWVGAPIAVPASEVAQDGPGGAAG